MFQPTTECVDSLTIDDVTWQAVSESGTGRTYMYMVRKTGARKWSRFMAHSQ